MTDQTYESLVDTLNAIYGEENPNQEDIRAFVVSYAMSVLDTVGVDRHHESREDTFLKMEGAEFVGYSIFENIEWDGTSLSIPYVDLVERVLAPEPVRKQIKVLVDDTEIGVAHKFEINRTTFNPNAPATTVQPVLGPRGNRGIAGTLLTEMMLQDPFFAESVERQEAAREFPPQQMPRDLNTFRGAEYAPELDPYLRERRVTLQRDSWPAVMLGNTGHGLKCFVDDIEVDIMVYKKTADLWRAVNRSWESRNEQAQREITNGTY
jgi:hypothetical protein